MRALRATATAIVVAAVALAGVRWLNPLPSLEGRSVSSALLDTEQTRLGRGIAPLIAQHPGLAGIHALPNARESFAARVLLARGAERSLDVQYYIWRGDLTGTLLFAELREAAQRGVRIRLLLDDNNTVGLDAILAALDAEANIEVRLFNPFVIRTPRLIGFVTDFFRLNRRMHNKSFTADSQATIVGGRNVGDEYFDAVTGDALLFADLDVLTIGPVVRDVSADFDRYWASASAYPADRLLAPVAQAEMTHLEARYADTANDPAAAAYMAAIRDSTVIAGALAGTLPFDWAPARMVSDDPAKGLGLASRDDLFLQRLLEIVGEPTTELQLVSPYFVPTSSGVETFTRLARGGVRIALLVNSLAATDVDAVHSGYTRRRKPLLEAGIRLYEMRRESQIEPVRRTGIFGSSASSLHAKTFAVDRQRLFVGSFNFDPRSANLNTEIGFVIESPRLARVLADGFERGIPERAYEVQLDRDGSLFWTETVDGETLRYDVEPETTTLQRALVFVLSLLPIEPLL
jgi:cardiolipin synthase C